MKILHVASEVAPHSKTGGLADVLGALPQALRPLGFDVKVVTPRYRSVDVSGFVPWPSPLEVPLGPESVEVGVLEKDGVYLIDHPPSFDRAGLYGEGGHDYPDNARRFAILGAAALAAYRARDEWPDILHGHDWQAGPALIYARHSVKRVFTIHNLAYQGLFAPSLVEELGFDEELYHPGGLEYWGQGSLLKAGIVLADRITTVSPGYAKEIKTEEQGFGLDGLLREHGERLVGILNGCDYEVWSPEKDPHLPARYSAAHLEGKRACKAALQRELGLPERAETPLCGSISRLAEQKGFDLVTQALPGILGGDAQYVVLGTGQPEIESALTALQQKYPDKLAVRIGYDEKLAHRIEAGCDLYVMPSRYEPCGLNQMYSLRYGTPPIVRATGGLDDTISDFDAASSTGTGFKFGAYSASALGEAWRRALLAFFSGAAFEGLVRRGMSQDFSWSVSARRYASLYRQLAFSPPSE
jgi:starch synthase